MRITRENLSPADDGNRWYDVDDGRRYWLSRCFRSKSMQDQYSLHQRHVGMTPSLVGQIFHAQDWDAAEAIAYEMIRNHKSQIVLDAMKEL